MKPATDKVSMRIRYLMAFNPITPAHVAAQLQVPKERALSWKKGTVTPCVRELSKLAILYGVTLAYLLTGHDLRTSAVARDRD